MERRYKIENRSQFTNNHYPIYIEKGILNHALDYISSIFHGQKIMIISDDQVYHYYGEQLKAQLSSVYCVSSLIVEHGEQS